MTASAIAADRPASALLRTAVISLTAFLTAVDLFAAQAILPALAQAYHASPADMGLALNASTLGMAGGGLFVGLFGARLDRRRTIAGSLALLAIPTLLLAFAPNLAVFAGLRIAQGLCMATAFSLSLAYLGDRYMGAGTAGAFAAYIAGNVASNLVGRLISAGVADHFGIGASFMSFAILNLAGALLAITTMRTMSKSEVTTTTGSWRRLWSNPRLRRAFGVGFCILFVFIGVFTYVNFVLARPPLELGMMRTGFAYFVFLPSIFTTPLAGKAVARIGTPKTLWASLGMAAVGLPMLLAPSLPLVLAGMTIVAIGTFFAQAVVTAFVGQAAGEDRAAASGTYLACYFLGGLAGTAVLGPLFDNFGWGACVAGVAVGLAAAAVMGRSLVVTKGAAA